MIQYLPSVIGAVAILVVGWVVAWLASLAVRAALRRTTIDNRVMDFLADDSRTKAIPIEEVGRKVVFYFLMLFVLIAFFEAIGLTIMTEPLNELLTEVFAFAPRVLAAAALFAVTWLVASMVRLVVSRSLGRLKLEEKMSAQADLDGTTQVSVARTLGEASYWLTFLVFLPAILGTLALQGLLEPVQQVVNELLLYLPNLMTALLILGLGWFVARVVQRVVTNLLAAMGTDQVGADVGVAWALGDRSLSSLLGLVVYVLILVPVIAAALNALAIDAVTEPASNLLDTILSAVPLLFAAALVLGVAYVVGKIVSGMVTNLLAGAGFDRVPAKLGLRGVPSEGATSPSRIVGTGVLVLAMLLALIEATALLGFDNLAGLFIELTAFGGDILIALVVAALTLLLANLAASAVGGMALPHAGALALIARIAVLVLGGAMALRELGVADEIVTLAFGLTFGAAAVAAAIAFGMGGRDLAARQLESWSDKLSKRDGSN